MTYRLSQTQSWNDAAIDAPMMRKFAEFAREDKHERVDRLMWWINDQFLGAEDVRHKHVLEVGSGRGLLSLYVAMQGAESVESMEPELDGSTSGVAAIQLRRKHELGLDNLELLPDDFNKWDPRGARFDIILLRASINHLAESPFHALTHSRTRQQLIDVVSKLRKLLRPNGMVIASDASRYGFWVFAKATLAKLRISTRWLWRMRTVDWRLHQSPGTWRRLFLDAGFQSVTIDYPYPFHLRRTGRLLNNRFASFFLYGSFVLRARL